MKYGQYPSEHTIIPWLSDEPFLRAYGEMSSRTLLPITKCYMLYSIARHVAQVAGAAAECGVYRGGSAYLLAKVFAREKPIYLLDSFTGLPPGDPSKDNRYINGGEFGDTSLAEVMKFLEPFENAQFRPGLVPDTFRGMESELFSFVHIDLDIYKPILDSLNFFYCRMSPGGVIVLDDYGAEECRGACLAVEEFCAALGAKPIVMPTGQAMLIRT